MADDLAALLAEHGRIASFGGSYLCPECRTYLSDGTAAEMVSAHQAEVIATAGWTTRRAVIEELIAKANHEHDTADDMSGYWAEVAYHTAEWLSAEIAYGDAE